MSRCFPYPPPGYIRHGLVESIKLDRENVLPEIKQKLHKKRERKEKEEKRKERKQKEGNRALLKKYKKLNDVFNGGCKDDQLQKSDITEEHGPPVCYISDGSQNRNNNKRKWDSNTLSSNECRIDGSTVKIRFSLKNPQETDASLSEESVCSTSRRADSSTLIKAQEQCEPLRKKPNVTPLVPEQKQFVPKQKLLDEDGGSQPELIPSSSGKLRDKDEQREPELIPSSSGKSRYDKKLQKAALQYKALIENWVPLNLQSDQFNDNCDDDWLSLKNHHEKPGAATKSYEVVDSNVSCSAGITSYPMAHFLPEAEIYALPYSVPF